MSNSKPSIPKGTRDFGPEQMGKRNFIFNTIRDVFHKYGFLPLETPAMENLSVLQGKYGDEGDQLLFKILNSGDFLKPVGTEDVDKGYKSMGPKITEKGLRYDLTVPFARFVVMNRNDITFPFKRYQIQPVWRADKPQKGRYREFYQCDADVIGTNSLLCEAEIVSMINEVFSNLNLKEFQIKINNRKILQGFVEVLHAVGKETAFCVAIDKLDKIGAEKVKQELSENGFSDDAIENLSPLLERKFNNNEDAIAFLEKFLCDSEIGTKGIQELKEIFDTVDAFGMGQSNVSLDITLARGLSYYTGAIFEVKATNASLQSSIGGGGRYDNLTGVFGMEGMSGVGFSFGVDRIYDVMEELGAFPQSSTTNTKVLFVNFGGNTQNIVLGMLYKMRQNGVSAELYPDPSKMKKQLTYADKKNIPYVILIGEDEIKEGRSQLKNMLEGTQEMLPFDEIIKKVMS